MTNGEMVHDFGPAFALVAAAAAVVGAVVAFVGMTVFLAVAVVPVLVEFVVHQLQKALAISLAAAFERVAVVFACRPVFLAVVDPAPEEPVVQQVPKTVEAVLLAAAAVVGEVVVFVCM